MCGGLTPGTSKGQHGCSQRHSTGEGNVFSPFDGQALLDSTATTRSHRVGGVQGLGMTVWGLGFRVWGLGFRVEGLGFRI